MHNCSDECFNTFFSTTTNNKPNLETKTDETQTKKTKQKWPK